MKKLEINLYKCKQLLSPSILFKLTAGISAFYFILSLSGCVAGPVYAYNCDCNPCGCVTLITLNYRSNCCTQYRPNYYYRCTNQRCTTYSPQAPNHCDAHPYYTGCKYTSCTPPNSQYP